MTSALDTTHARSAATLPADRIGAPDRARALWSAMRPRQWMKNGLVLAAPALAGTLLSGSVIVPAIVMTLAMCAAASSTYLINDLNDRERDRQHPTKCRRPIASGALSPRWAWTACGVLIAAAIGASLLLGPGPLAITVTYLLVTITYSGWVKHIPYLELLVVGSGFVLRVAAGAAATSTALSIPFLVVVGAGSLMLATGKRISELRKLGESAAGHRPVLAAYRPVVLDRIVGGSLTVMLGAYTGWAVARDTGASGAPWLVLSIIPVAVAVLHVARLVLGGDVGDPTTLISSDRVIRVAGGLTLVLLVIALYLP